MPLSLSSIHRYVAGERACRASIIACMVAVLALGPHAGAAGPDLEGDRPTVLVLDAQTGKPAWRSGLGHETSVVSVEYTLDDTVYGEVYSCPHYNRPAFYDAASFVAIDLATRAERWRVEVSDHAGHWSRAFGAGFANAFGAGRTAVVVAGPNASLQGLRPKTGEVLWEQPLGPAYPTGGNRDLVMVETPPQKDPPPAPGALDFSPAVGGQLDAHDRQTGALRWTWKTPNGWGVTRVVVSENAVVAATFNPLVADALRGIDVRTGEELWEQVLPSGALFIPKFDLFGRVLVFEDETGTVRGFDATNGGHLWDFTGTVVRTERSAAPPLLLVRPPNQTLTRLDPSDGSPLWKLPRSSTIGPIAVGDELIVLSARSDAGRDVYEDSPLDRHDILAIDADSGQTRWRKTVPKEVAPGFGQTALVGSGRVVLSGGCNVVRE